MMFHKKFLTLCSFVACSIFANAQKIRAIDTEPKFLVNGAVVNAATGKPIRGIRITYKTYAASLTDTAGNFSIKLPGGDVMLLAEGDGYQSKEIAVRRSASLKIVMYEDGFSSFSDEIVLPTGRLTKTLSPYAVAGVQVTDGWNRYGEIGRASCRERVLQVV